MFLTQRHSINFQTCHQCPNCLDEKYQYSNPHSMLLAVPLPYCNTDVTNNNQTFDSSTRTNNLVAVTGLESPPRISPRTFISAVACAAGASSKAASPVKNYFNDIAAATNMSEVASICLEIKSQTSTVMRGL